MSEKIDFFMSALDLHISMGKVPSDALANAVEDYAAVYHPAADDNRSPLAKAAEVVLRHYEEIRVSRSEDQH